MLRDYYSLTKPGLVYGNLIPAIGGFALAARNGGAFNFTVFAVPFMAAIIGLAFVMASGCVFNNIIDYDIDHVMRRTRERAIVTGNISPRAATVFAAILGAAGLIILAIWTNWLTAAAGAFGFFAYVFLYSLWSKRQTVYSTEIGSISGAMPPVVGYAAASGRLDLAATLLFTILVVWQMPHFFAIGIYRKEDYVAANLPIRPVKRSLSSTKIQMLLYIILFGIAVSLLTVFGYTGIIFLTIALVMSAVWLGLCLRGFTLDLQETKPWARRMFFLSLIVLVVLFAAIALG